MERMAAPAARLLGDEDVKPGTWVCSEDGAVYVDIPCIGEPITMLDAIALRNQLDLLVLGFADAQGLGAAVA